MASTKDQGKGRRSVDFRQRREQFDRAWQGTKTPAIERFVPSPETAASFGYTRRQLLAELVEIDIECRWKAGFPRSHFDSTDDVLPSKPRVEDYLVRFPELGTVDDLPVEVVIQEYKARHKSGEPVDHEEFLSRFPAIADRLSVELRNAQTNMTEPTARFVRCPQCHSSIAVPELAALAREVVTCECGEKVPIIDARTGDHREGEMVGNYRLLRWLGRGSFANVWQAFDEHLERNVALKIPYARRQGEAKPNLPANEAKAVAGLEHPNIVRVYELGKGEDAFIASEFIAGQNLETALRHRPRSPVETAELCRKLADALRYMHTQKKPVVHRDIKPSNILLDEHDEPHLTDFGLAKRESESIALSSAGELIGTVAYMSPEQAAGKGDSADGRSDIFSLGIVMYEMLAGTLPFHGDRLTIMNKIQKEDPPSILRHAPKTPRDLETICFRCLEKEPTKRFATAAELADELGRFLRGEPILTRPASRFERLRKWAKRHPARAIAATMSAVATAAIIVALGLALQQSRQRSEDLVELVEKATTLKAEIKRRLEDPRYLDDIFTINAIRRDNEELTLLVGDIRDLAPNHTWSADDVNAESIDAPAIFVANVEKALQGAESKLKIRDAHVAEIKAIEAALAAVNEHYRTVMALLGSSLFTGLPFSDAPQNDAAQNDAAPRRSPLDGDVQNQRIAAQTNRVAEAVADVSKDKQVELSANAGPSSQPDPVTTLPSVEPVMPTFPSNEEDSLRGMQTAARAALVELGVETLQPEELNANAEPLWNRMRKAEENAGKTALSQSPQFHDRIEPLKRRAAELILLHAYATFQLGEPNATNESRATPQSATRALAQVQRAERLGLATPHAATGNQRIAPKTDDILNHVSHTYRQMVAEFTALRDGLQPVDTELPVSADASWFDHFFAGCRHLPRHSTDDRQSMYASALEHFKASDEMQSESPWIGYFMAVCYIRTGQSEAAEDKLTRHKVQVGEFPFTYVLRGIARSQIYRHNAARKAVALAGAQSDFQAALNTISQAVSDNRMSLAVARRLRYAVLMSRGTLYFDASSTTRESLEKAATDFTAAREEARLLGDESRVEQASGQLAIVAWHRGRKSEALREINVLVDKLPADAPSQAELLMTRAEMRLKNDPVGAAEDFLAVYTQHASTAEQQAAAGVNYAWIAGLTFAGGDWEAALRVCDEVAALPKRTDSAESTTIQQRALDAHLIAAMVRLREARKLAPQAVRLARADSDREVTAEVRAKLERDALASLDAYLANGGDDPKVFEMRAGLRFRLGGRVPDMAGAAEDYGRAAVLLRARADRHAIGSQERLDIEKDELRMLRLRGWCLARSGQARQAVAAFNRAIDDLGDTTMQTRIGRGFARVLALEPAPGLEDADYVAKHSQDAYDLYRAAGIYALAAGYASAVKDEQERLTWKTRGNRSLDLLERALAAVAASEAQGATHAKAERIRAFRDSNTLQQLWNFERYLELMKAYSRPVAGARDQSTPRTIPIGGVGGGK